MNAITGRHVLLYLVLAGLLVPAAAVRAQAPDERITRVLADWKRRQQAIQTVRYTITGQRLSPKGSRPVDPVTGRKPTVSIPPRDVTEQIDYRLLLDFAKQRFRWESREDNYVSDRDQVFPRISTTVYDRTDCMAAWPRAENAGSDVYRDPQWPDVSISRKPEEGDLVTNGLGVFLRPILLGHGLVRGMAVRARFRQDFDPENFLVHGEGVQAGRRCLVLRSQPLDLPDERPTFDEFWVDVERDSAVLRQETWTTGWLATIDEIAYQATAKGWVASGWKSTDFTPEKRTMHVTRMDVTDVVPEPAVEDADFRVAIEPGMIVREFTPIAGNPVGATRKDYRVRPDGGWNEIVNGVEKQSLGLLGGKGIWAYGLGGGLVGLLVALLIWRRWRRGRLPPEAPPHPTPLA